MTKTRNMVVGARSPERVSVDARALPKHESDALCRVLLRCVGEYFKDPKVAADYEQWREARKKAEKDAEGRG